MRLGSRQLDSLIGLARPTVSMIVPGAVEASLIKRGLLKANKSKRGGFSFARITPAGLRALADAMEAGRFEDPLTAFKREAKARKRREAKARKHGR